MRGFRGDLSIFQVPHGLTFVLHSVTPVPVARGLWSFYTKPIAVRSNPTNRARVLADILAGLPRVVDAILATPPESRMNVVDAVLKSYQKTAIKLLGAGQAEELLDEIVVYLRAEVNGRREPQQARLKLVN
jgi:hypothetical protein